MVSYQDMISFYKKLKQAQGDSVTTEVMNTDDDDLGVTICDNDVVSDMEHGQGVSTNYAIHDRKINNKKKVKFVTPVNNKDSEKSQILEILKKNKPKASGNSRIPLDKPALTFFKMTPEANSNPVNAPESVKNVEIVSDVITTHPPASPVMTQDNVMVSVVTSAGESEVRSKALYINDGQILECVNCKLKYASLNELNDHQCEVKRPEIIYCSLCNIKFKNRKIWKAHIKHKHLKLAHTCQKCSKLFPTEKTLNKHFLSVHVNHECQFCKLIFKNANSLKSHRSRCKLKKKLPEPSNDGNIVPSNHEKTAFQCTNCEKTCKTAKALEGHFARQHIQQNCQYCDHTFKNKEVLRIHLYKCRMKKLALDKPESPGEKGTNTDQVKLMENDNKKEQNSTGKSSNNYEKICNLCQKKFGSKSGFYKHRNNVHKDHYDTDVAKDTGEVIILDAGGATLSEGHDNILMFEL